MGKARRIYFRVRGADRKRLELISETLDISMTAAFRASLVAMSRQLGFEKEFSEDFLKEK